MRIAIAGVRTSTDFAALFSALMADLMDGRIPIEKATAMCNAGGKLLKVVELQHKFGKGGGVLQLAPEGKGGGK